MALRPRRCDHRRMHKFNNGRGATVCDSCRCMVVNGSTQIAPFVTVTLREEPETGAAHFCRLACLETEIARAIKSLDDRVIEPEVSAASLRRMILAFARWEVASTGVVLPYSDDMDHEGGRAMNVEPRR
jgi:hypothetical protein